MKTFGIQSATSGLRYGYHVKENLAIDSLLSSQLELTHIGYQHTQLLRRDSRLCVFLVKEQNLPLYL